MAKKRKRRNPNTIPRFSTISAETVASIDDVLTQILIKVPIKPLFRFKLVNKHWLSLISSHEFGLIRNPNPNPACGIFLCIKSRDRYSNIYFPLNNPISFEPPSINLYFTTAPVASVVLDSCNGLMLCCSSKSRNYDIDTLLNDPNCSFYVFNPTTKSSVALPELPVYEDFIFQKAATLVFDPVRSPYFKVVLVMHKDKDPNCEIRICSSQTGSWSYGCVYEIAMSRHRDVLVSGVYWNGSVHWLSGKLYADGSGQMSLRFHVDTRMLHEMPSPPVLRDQYYRSSNYYFGESCGHLHFVEPVLPVFNVYEMKTDYSEWFAKYRVDLSLLIADYPEVVMRFENHIYYHIYVLSLIRGQIDKDAKLVLRIQGKAIKFNLVDGTSEKMCDFVHDKKSYDASLRLTGGSIVSSKFSKEYGLDYIQSLYSC